MTESKKGLLIAIEGTDGSGKATQTELLKNYLNRNSSAVAFSFPDYEGNTFGKEVRHFLNGDYGELNEVHPKFASMLYATDRLESRERLIEAQMENDYVILDRYVQSNMIHQGSRMSETNVKGMIDWISYLEYDINKMPRPDVTLFLNVPPTTSDTLVEKRARTNFATRQRDIQESDKEHILNAYNLACELAYDEKWEEVVCTEQGYIKSITQVHELVLLALGMGPLSIPVGLRPTNNWGVR